MHKLIHRIIQFQKMGSNSDDEVSDYIMIACVDKRIIPNDFTKVPIGHLYVVRNAGNFVPTHDHHNFKEISSEGGAIELAVKLSGIKDIIISGHSDCKAMDYLEKINHPDTKECKSHGPLSDWIKKYGRSSWEKYQMHLKDRDKPLTFQLKPPPTPVTEAYFDEKLNLMDVLSQINCLQQTEHVATFPFLVTDLLEHRVRIHTLWKELSSTDEDHTLHLFDIHEGRFMKITEEVSEKLISDIE